MKFFIYRELYNSVATYQNLVTKKTIYVDGFNFQQQSEYTTTKSFCFDLRY